MVLTGKKGTEEERGVIELQNREGGEKNWFQLGFGLEKIKESKERLGVSVYRKRKSRERRQNKGRRVCVNRRDGVV